MSILCKLGIHQYKPDGIPTKAKGLGGTLIYKPLRSRKLHKSC